MKWATKCTMRVECLRWKEPGVVIGQDGAVVFVRHKGTYVRVNYLRPRKVSTDDQHLNDNAENDNTLQGEELTQAAERNMDIDDYTENGTNIEQREQEMTGATDNNMNVTESECTGSTTRMQSIITACC